MNTYTKPFTHKPVRTLKKLFTRFTPKRGQFIDFNHMQALFNITFPFVQKPKNESILQVLGALPKPDLHRFVQVATKQLSI